MKATLKKLGSVFMALVLLFTYIDATNLSAFAHDDSEIENVEIIEADDTASLQYSSSEIETVIAKARDLQAGANAAWSPGNWHYDTYCGYCTRFVVDSFYYSIGKGMSSAIGDASQMADRMITSTNLKETPPRGAAVFFDYYGKYGYNVGHVGISLGDGTYISAVSSGIKVFDLSSYFGSNYISDCTYIGWGPWCSDLGYTLPSPKTTTSYTQQDIVDAFLAQVGTSGYTEGGVSYCLWFVAKIFNTHPKLGIDISTASNAQIYADQYLVSTSTDIPLGADVFFYYKGSSYGHIGVYVGNGYMVDCNSSGVIVKRPITGFTDLTYRGWGWHGGYVPKGYSSSGTETPKYAAYDKQLSSSDPQVTTALNLIMNQNNNSVRAGKTKKDMISYLLYDSQYAVFGGQDWPVSMNGDSAGSITDKNLSAIDGTTTIALDTYSWGSMSFCWFASSVVYTEKISLASTRKYFDGKAGEYNKDTIRSNILTNLQAGEHLRISDICSLCYISGDNTGFYFMQYGSDDDSDKHIRMRYATYDTFTTWLNSTGKDFWYYTVDNDVNGTKSVSNLTIASIGNQTYTGSAIKPNVTVKDGSTALTKDMHYTVSYSNNTNVGTATVTITGKGNYTGTKTATFKIVAKSISGATVSTVINQTYTGSAQKPAVTVKDGSKTLTNGTDYTVSYSNNTNVGTATVTITGKGNYTGTRTTTFKIVAKSISGTTISDIADQTYTGSAITPAVTVKDGTKTLVNGTDYTVAYSNNTNVGAATVTITGKGNYTGTNTATFNIVAAVVPPASVKATAGEGKITLTWDAVTGATKYRVRRNDGTGWVNYKDLTSTSFTDTAVTNGTKYSYAVYAYVGNAWSGASAIVSATPVGSVIAQNVKATAGTGKVTLTWSAVSGATKYRVRRNDGSGWVNYKELTSTSFTDTAVTNGTKYSYAVYAYVGNAWGGASAIVSATPTGSVIAQNVKATAGTGKVTLTWSAVSGATKYRVRRNDGSGWVNYKDLTSTSFTDTAVTNGTKYSYAIYSYVGNAWGGASAIVSATPTGGATIAQNVKATASDGMVTLTWNEVNGATKYRVRRNDGTGWANYKDVKATALTDNNVNIGTTYVYAVYAYVNGAWGEASAIVSATLTSSTTVIAQNVKATAGDSEITLTWNAVDGATKYRIRRNDGTGWVNYKDLTENAYADTAVTSGKAYSYAIYTYVNGAWSDASTIVSATA